MYEGVYAALHNSKHSPIVQILFDSSSSDLDFLDTNSKHDDADLADGGEELHNFTKNQFSMHTPHNRLITLKHGGI